MKITQHLLISGHVQGVSFRFFTQKNAQKLNLTGWVRNLKDGRVEVVVQGGAEQFQALNKILMRGPEHARVSGIEVQLVQNDKDMKEFNIAPDGEGPCLKK